MLMVEFDEPPNWSLCSERNWGECKMPEGSGGWVNSVGVKGWKKN